MKNLLTSAQAAKILGISEYTLRKSRMTGTLWGKEPPPYTKFGPKAIRYSVEDLEKWVERARNDALL